MTADLTVAAVAVGASSSGVTAGRAGAHTHDGRRDNPSVTSTTGMQPSHAFSERPDSPGHRWPRAVSATMVTDHQEMGREDVELLRLLAVGLSLESVARRLDLSERTVRRRMRSVCDRLGLGTPIEAVVWAVRRGLL